MEFSINSITTISTILLTGLTAGLCFTWTNAVTPGIGRLDDLGYLQSFQEMNRAIINPLFLDRFSLISQISISTEISPIPFFGCYLLQEYYMWQESWSLPFLGMSLLMKCWKVPIWKTHPLKN